VGCAFLEKAHPGAPRPLSLRATPLMERIFRELACREAAPARMKMALLGQGGAGSSQRLLPGVVRKPSGFPNRSTRTKPPTTPAGPSAQHSPPPVRRGASFQERQSYGTEHNTIFDKPNSLQA